MKIDFGTTPKSIIKECTVVGDKGERYIPEDAFKDLAEAIEGYANFQIGIELAGEDI